MKTSVELSNHDCYAGKMRLNISGFNPDIHSEAGIYVEFQEGCGYNVRDLTLEEAEKVCAALLAAIEEQKQFVSERKYDLPGLYR